MLGAVGQLQLEVVKHRLLTEYGVGVRLESVPHRFARWVSRADGDDVDIDDLCRRDIGVVVLDVRDRPVVLFEAEWSLSTAARFHAAFFFAETASGVVARDD